MAPSIPDRAGLFFTKSNAIRVCGKVSRELAKITGMTPPAFTFEGQVVAVRPSLRPITRLAYCTGMRRSPRFASTMKATTATIHHPE